MRLYSIAPDPHRVNSHFMKMAKGELNGKRVQVGYGFAGSRLNVNASSRLEKAGSQSSPELVVNQITPGQVGVQQARSQLLANELKRKTTGKQIKRLLGSISRQKSSGNGRKKTSRRKSKTSKKPQQKKKKKKPAKKSSGVKKGRVKKVKSARRRDNFS